MRTPTSLSWSLALPLLLWIAALSVPIILSAQPPDSSAPELRFLIGESVGLHQVQHTLGIRAIKSRGTPLFNASNSLGWFAGTNVELLINNRSSLSLDLRYNNLPGSSETTHVNPMGYSERIEIIEHSLVPSDTIIDFKSEIAYSSFSIGLLNKWRFFVKDTTLNVGISGGPVFHIITGKEIKQTESLVSPFKARLISMEGTVEEKNGRTLVLYDGEIPNSTSTRFGIHIGVFAEFGNPWSGIAISPSIFYDYGIQPVTSTENWFMHTISTRISLLTGF